MKIANVIAYTAGPALFLILMGFCAENAVAQAPGGVQATSVVKRGDLTIIAGTARAAEVKWAFSVKGKAGALCSLTSDGTNDDEIMLRVTDNGGLSGDPICELSLTFESLKNHFTFESVTIGTYRCGNDPCEKTVLTQGTTGSNSLGVVVSARMKGTLLSNVSSIFRVTPTLRGPVGFNPFKESAKPDLVVSKIDEGPIAGTGSCSAMLTLANLGDPNWAGRQAFAYNGDPGRAVLISLRKDKVVCGSSSVTLIQFDPKQGMNQASQPVTAAWPDCTFRGTATFTATLDVENRLFEREETAGKSMTVKLQCPIAVQPR